LRSVLKHYVDSPDNRGVAELSVGSGGHWTLETLQTDNGDASIAKICARNK